MNTKLLGTELCNTMEKVAAEMKAKKKTRKLFRVILKGPFGTAGFGESPSEAIANLKARVTGDAINYVMKCLAEDDQRIKDGGQMWYYRYDTAIAKMFEDYKRRLLENSEQYFDVFDEELDEDRDEYRTLSRDTWYPKYEIKF